MEGGLCPTTGALYTEIIFITDCIFRFEDDILKSAGPVAESLNKEVDTIEQIPPQRVVKT